MKWLKLATWLAVAVALVFLQDAVSVARHGFRIMPKLVMNLPGAESEYGDKLNAGVREKFPPGSQEAPLIDYLKAEGFTPDWRRGAGPNSASFERDGLICQKAVSVTWQADAGGKLTDVGASYRSACAVEQPFAQALKPNGAKP